VVVGLVDSSDRQEGRGYAAALRTFRRLIVLGLLCGGLALPARACRTLEGWRRARASTLGFWIFVLGHELTHAQQSDLYNAPWGRPFDEAEADCGGYAKFEAIRFALGIRRTVNPPPRSFSECPLKRAYRR